MLTGRNAHTVNMGGHNMFARELPGYNGRIPASAGTLAENLRQAGYRTFALGKWDHLPVGDTSPSGPFTYWPLRQGFDRFYGFVASETDNFHPHLWRDTVPCEIAGSLEEATRMAAAAAQPGQTVLFSPGTSSFDMFSGYAERGDVFRRAVESLT